MKKTERDIEDFLAQKTLCVLCQKFKEDLCSIYEEKGLDACNTFISNYNGFVCSTIESFKYFSDKEPKKSIDIFEK